MESLETFPENKQHKERRKKKKSNSTSRAQAHFNYIRRSQMSIQIKIPNKFLHWINTNTHSLKLPNIPPTTSLSQQVENPTEKKRGKEKGDIL